ncbi:DUF3857 domain-containing protein [Gramella sp. AN32]|uniref:DUF3857 domain-containing protein n=1 Tax=Christiangramia antarctica TaxID=2058158 RepID=A0ABW5X351_9FLAO|nr:DUF3857 domain-containing protein [Gramella sp. AN32]MCM4156675.1 hypothetical protein [Gramella sp. AN32]
MKNSLIILGLILIGCNSFAQSKKESDIREIFWGADDKFSAITEIPEEFQNESAVVIYKNENYSYNNFLTKMTTVESVRKRIKLLDKAAVEEFSEFAYKNRFRSSQWLQNIMAGEKHIVGIKVIKPDGSESIVDVESESVEVDGETKIAISNLEPGDIIDYYSYREDLQSSYGARVLIFDAVEAPLAEEYPMMNYRLEILTDNDFFLNFRSFNGAPQLTEEDNGKRGKRLSVLEATNIEKKDFPRWFYPLVELPAYKFQVYYAYSKASEKDALAFLPEKESIVKSEVSPEEIMELYDNKFRPSGNFGMVEDYIKENNITNEAEIVKNAYYYMRHMYLTRFIEASLIQESKISNDAFKYFGYAIILDNEKEFVRYFTSFLKEFDIDYEIVVGKYRYDGSLADILIEQNTKTLLKTKTSPPVYIEFYDPHSDAGAYSHNLDGTEVYLLSSAKRKKIDQIEKSRLPETNIEDNRSHSDLSINIHNDLSGFSVESKHEFYGHEKKSEQQDRMFFADYVHEDYEKFDTEPYLDKVKKKERDQYETELNSLAEKIRTRQKEFFEEKVAAGFDLEEVQDYDYKITETGRFGFEQPFKFTETYNVDNSLFKKAGNDYIFEIGKLIGGQIDLTEKERKRTENIYMPYPKSLVNNLRISIPEGYSIEGLEKLNLSADNSTGRFMSSATIEGDELVINTQKDYKSYYQPNSNWGLIIDFLDTANQFYNAKVLLKKN